MRSLFLSTMVAAWISPLLAAEVPETIAAARGEVHVVTMQAVGAQVYECRADAIGKLTWQFREPIATLFVHGKTVGRHYAGPTWEAAEGSFVRAKSAGRAPGATAADIPLLKLEVTSGSGSGQIGTVTMIQRLNTKGGTAEGACAHAGALMGVPYTADYAFYKKVD